MSDKQISKHELLWITLACLGYFFILLGSRVLNVPDEGRYSEVARAMLLTGDFITPRMNGVAFFHKPILHYWLQNLSFMLFGINEWAIRLMPALFGVLGVAMTYIAATLIYGRQTGRLAALMLASNPLYYLSTHYADMNLEVAVLISCSLLCFVIAIRYPFDKRFGSKRRNLLWAAYIFAGFAVLTKGMIGIVFPAMIIGAWIMLSGQWRLLKEMYIPSGLFLFVLIALPWFIAVQIQNPGFLHYFFIYQHFTRFTGSGFNNAFQDWFYLPVLLLGFFPWSMVFVFAIKDSLKRIFAATHTRHADLFLGLWFLLILIFFSLPESKIVGYILPVLPAMAILSAAYLLRRMLTVEQTGKYPHVFIGVAVIALILGLAIYALPVTDMKHAEQLLRMLPYLQAVFLVSGSVILLFALMRKLRLSVAAMALTGSSFSFVLLAIVIPISTADSIKPLADLAKDSMRPGDLVVSYEDYYYDLGIYLQWQDHIIVVSDWGDENIASRDNWRSEFYHGFPDTEGEETWMIKPEAFAQRINDLAAGQRMFVFTPEIRAGELEKQYPLEPIFTANGNTLMQNK
jgi:4-amino-4-deoxy-L-arabinose transferase-like glycosyltransferase